MSKRIRRTSTDPGQKAESLDGGLDLQARIPGNGSFTVTGEAAAMVGVFGGTLHCYVGTGGCRKQGLHFSRTEPKKPLHCSLSGPGQNVGELQTGPDGQPLAISVSHDLAPRLDGAVLDFGSYNKMQRFVWAAMPAVKVPACTCLRSMGAPAGKRSPCLDDQGVGLSDL